MNRKDFIKQLGVLGVGASAFPSLLSSCGEEDFEVNFDGKVIVIGAGAAGLMAAYTLKKHNTDFQLIEATSIYGGRVKLDDTLADFPIDIGAEWIHTAPTVFGRLLDNDDASGSIDIVSYSPKTMYNWNDGQLEKRYWQSPFYGEFKFKSTTWHQFFTDFVVPEIKDNIVYNSPITSIDYAGDEVSLEDESGNKYTANRVLITVPLNVLKADIINFEPGLPASKTDALAKTSMPPGLKVFVKFSERFYHDIITVAATTTGDTERIYYDAAFNKDTDDNVLALFNVGGNAHEFTDLDDEGILAKVMSDLDAMFDGKASETYQSHIIQNWSKEPYVLGSYIHAGDDHYDVVDAIKAPVDGKVYFAGEALHADEWSTVHGAGFSGIETVKEMLQTAL